MRVFEIDVSGKDLLSKDYVICIADKDNLIKGFKFTDKLVKDLSSKFGQGFYRYRKSKRGKSHFRIRLYCIIIYYLFKSLRIDFEISLSICRDFDGREDDIRKSLNYFLKNKLGLRIEDRIYFCNLSDNSNAHKYAYLMRHDRKNQLPNYIQIKLENIEKWLK